MAIRLIRRLVCALLIPGGMLAAQGQDSTPSERYLLVMAEMLPGIYDNANQHYFDQRRKLDDSDRHARINTTITRIDAPAFGDHVFLWIDTRAAPDGEIITRRLASLHVEDAGDEVVMRHYFPGSTALDENTAAAMTPADLRRTDGCDYRFKRRASQFRGSQGNKTCVFQWQGQEVHTANTIELSETGLWFVDHKYRQADGKRISGVASGEPYWLERARLFHCYADIPGVGGGRDVPFERYEDFTLHDKGGSHWFTTRGEAPRTIGLVLQSVTWHVLNEENGNFNRDSLVIYALEKMPDGGIVNHGYAFTEPGASRIGNNMKWMLVNCAMTPRDQARPEM